MTPSDRNHAHDRIHGGGEPMKLAYAPGPADWRRWLLVDAERVVRAEEDRVNDPPAPEE